MKSTLIVGIVIGVALSLGSIANAALVALPPNQGGTGTSDVPTYGKIPVGNAGGTYTLTATSSLGISSSGGSSFSYPFPSNATTTNITFSNGLTGNLTGNADTVTNGVYTTGAGTVFLAPNGSAAALTSFPTLNQNTTGSAATLTTPRAINGVNFDGSAAITVTAASSTLLADGNTFSGTNTFSNLITGSISGNAATVTNGVYTTGAGTVFLAPNGSAASLTNFPTLNQNTTGTAASLSAILANSLGGTGQNSAAWTGSVGVNGGTWYQSATTTAGTGLTYSGNAFSVNTSQNIATLSNLTGNGFIKTSGGNGTLSIDTTTYESALTAGDGLTRTANDFDCDTASGTTFGCLSSANWTTFNNKQDTITAGDALTLTGTDIDFDGGTAPSGELGGTWGAITIDDNLTVSGWNLGNATSTTFAITGLGTAAGAFLAVNPDGSVIATTTPSSGSGTVGSGTTGQFPYYAANGTALTATSTLSIATNGTLTIDNGLAGDAVTQYGATGYEWSIGAKSSDDTFRISSSTSLGTSDALTIDKNLLVTIGNASTTNLSVATNTYLTGITSALTLTGANGLIAEYAGTSCTNQFVRSLSALGAATCATVANTDLANSTISGIALGSNLADLTATNATLTFSGTYNGSTARSIGLNLASANTWTGGQTFANATTTGTLTIPVGASVTTPSAGNLAIDTTTGQLRYSAVDGTTKVMGNGNQYASFTYATSTAWTGTTTIPLGTARLAEGWNDAQCYTDAGTLQVSFNDGTNRMNFMNASTTANTNTLSTNNTFTAGEKRYVDIGTPATSPTKISCTISKSLTSD